MKDQILNYFSRLRPDLQHKQELLDMPIRMILSSVEFVEFLWFLERDLHLTLDDSQINEENFATVGTLLALIARMETTT